MRTPLLPIAVLLLVACKPEPSDTGPGEVEGGEEVCNGKDDDGDGQIDEGVATTWYRDLDGDGYGQDDQATDACSAPEGYAEAPGDCDDADEDVFPGATETCDGEDEDCDGDIDEEATTGTWYEDADGDGFGGALLSTECEGPADSVPDGGDCDDLDATVHPDATEVCNGIDDDCDAATPEDGMAAFTHEDGTWEDWTERLSSDAGDTVVHVVTEPGELLLCAGTWPLAIRARASVQVRGATGDRDDVVLDAGGAQGVLVNRTEGVELSAWDLTLTGGEGVGAILGEYTAGGGVECDGGAAVELIDVAVVDNHAGVGGGVFARDCDVVLGGFDGGVYIQDNEAAYYGGGVFVMDGNARLVGALLWDNQADYGGGLAAVSMDADTDVDLVDTELSDNQASRQGGGMILEDASLSAQGGSVTGNTANTGGGAFLHGEATLSVSTSNWGSDSDDNDPEDVNVSDQDYGEDATFSCTTEGCE